MVSVRPSSYGCTREDAKYERSARVARGDSRVGLWLLEFVTLFCVGISLVIVELTQVLNFFDEK